MNSEYINKFFDNYSKKVLPKLEKLEQIRLSMLKKYKSAKDNDKEYINYEYKKMVNKSCKQEVFECFDFIDEYKFEKIDPDKLNVFIDSKLLSSSSKQYLNFDPANDYFSGVYKNVEFEIIEFARCFKLNDDNYYSSDSKQPSALFINIKLNKTAKSEVIVIRRNYDKLSLVFVLLFVLAFLILIFFSALSQGELFPLILVSIFGLLIIYIIIWAIFTSFKYQKIDLEDPTFLKKYKVIAQDQIEARYLLTTAFIDRFNMLKSVFKGDVSCSFHKNNITFMIKTKKDMFEISDINFSATDPKFPNEFYKEVVAICDIIDYFKLNERTGL